MYINVWKIRLEKVYWIKLVRDRHALAKTVTTLQVTNKAWNFSASWRTLSISGTTQLHGVSLKYEAPYYAHSSVLMLLGYLPLNPNNISNLSTHGRVSLFLRGTQFAVARKAFVQE
jgi:hypothetical protein